MAKKHDGLGGQARREPRVAAYIRVSAVMGRGDDLISPEIQEKAFRALCEREDLNIVPVQTDLDLTGRAGKRRHIGPLIDRVRSDEIDGIAVYNFARWGRNTGESLRSIETLRQAGGFLISASEPSAAARTSPRNALQRHRGCRHPCALRPPAGTSVRR